MRLPMMLVLSALVTGQSLAQQGASPDVSAAPCAAIDADLPAPLGDWKAWMGVGAALSAQHLPHAPLALGQGYEASLHNTPKINFPQQPEKPGGSVAFAGLFSFTVQTEGAYTVALGAAAWIDVLEDGKAVTPTSFGHGPTCTSVRKVVVFPLKPGTHVLQVSSSAAPRLRLMIVKAS